MPQKPTNTYNSQQLATNSALEFVAFSSLKIAKQHVSPLTETVLAIQTTRHHPVENNAAVSSPYQGFNLGLHVGDCSSQVAKNRQCLQQLLPTNTKIQWLEQVHGSEVVSIEHVSSHPITADAAITREKNVCLAVMTADCLPILLTSKSSDEVAAIHGGWRPLAANIISHTINKMHTKGAEIYAWLGPCIGKNAFEVGHEVKDAFVSQNKLFSQAFKVQHGGKYLADLQKIAELQLQLLGVKNISTLPECTFAHVDKYYSYRRTAITGRMASLICLQ